MSKKKLGAELDLKHHEILGQLIGQKIASIKLLDSNTLVFEFESGLDFETSYQDYEGTTHVNGELVELENL
jgi:hypothetical protein